MSVYTHTFVVVVVAVVLVEGMMGRGKKHNGKKKRKKRKTGQWLAGKRNSRVCQSDVPLWVSSALQRMSLHDAFLKISTQSLPGDPLKRHFEQVFYSSLLFSSLLTSLCVK